MEDPEFLASDTLFEYDLVVTHFRNDAPLRRGKRVRENLAKVVKQGKGIVLLHFACGAVQDWPDFRNLAGRVHDGFGNHDRRAPFTVRIVNQDHPITHKMRDFQADDELYTCLTG